MFYVYFTCGAHLVSEYKASKHQTQPGPGTALIPDHGFYPEHNPYNRLIIYSFLFLNFTSYKR